MSGARSFAETNVFAVNDAFLPSPARKNWVRRAAVCASVVAVLRTSVAAPVHLNGVLGKSSVECQRTPSPAMHPASGPWPTDDVQRKWPPARTKPLSALKTPAPVRRTAPVGAPLTSRALKAKPTLGPVATAEDAPSTTIGTAAASTAAARASTRVRFDMVLRIDDSWTRGIVRRRYDAERRSGSREPNRHRRRTDNEPHVRDIDRVEKHSMPTQS